MGAVRIDVDVRPVDKELRIQFVLQTVSLTDAGVGGFPTVVESAVATSEINGTTVPVSPVSGRRDDRTRFDNFLRA